jgi:hypothetical protein
MTDENIKRVREEVKRGGWEIIWLGAEMPCPFLDEPVFLLYEDMDGNPCICAAIYTRDRNQVEFRPYFKRDDGAKMVNCIAWKHRKDPDA